MFGEYKKTQRGYDRVSFEDDYGVKCHLQQSSAGVIANDDGSVDGPLGWLWLGLDDAEPKIMKSDAVRLGMKVEGEISGYMTYPLPEEVFISTCMHLDEKLVRGLVERLTLWLETGSLEEEKEEKEEKEAARPNVQNVSAARSDQLVRILEKGAEEKSVSCSWDTVAPQILCSNDLPETPVEMLLAGITSLVYVIDDETPEIRKHKVDAAGTLAVLVKEKFEKLEADVERLEARVGVDSLAGVRPSDKAST